MLTFTNAKIFDGLHDRLATGLNVVIEGDRIVEISDRPARPDSDVIDCGGRTLMPGLIDAHIHAHALDVNPQRIHEAPPTLYAHFANDMLRKMLDRGFTSARDTGGADYGLYLALQRGWAVGPRLFYCGQALSQTGGHGDLRHQHHRDTGCGDFHACGCAQAGDLMAVVDGVDAVRRAVRENFRRGASFIKFMGSGGVTTTGDALTHMQFSDDEIRVIVDESERHGGYCTAHIHPDQALRRAIDLGVHCIEHGTLIEPDTAALAAERGTYIVPTLAIIRALGVEGPSSAIPRNRW
jgi:imidazolonepropionase-like amidohydrolase